MTITLYRRCNRLRFVIRSSGWAFLQTRASRFSILVRGCSVTSALCGRDPVTRSNCRATLPLNGLRGLSDYWRTFGPESTEPIPAPASLQNVETRAVRFPTSALQSLDSADLNIVGQHLDLEPVEKFDLVVATNILVYYDPLEQALAFGEHCGDVEAGWLSPYK